MTTVVNQKEAVFNAVTSVVDAYDDAPVEFTKEQRATIIGMLTTGLSEGSIQVSEAKQAKMTEETHYRDYASNILNNWTRKDPRLNGGVKYEAKNPGSRAGSGDEQIKELKKLKTTLTSPEHIAAVDEAIDNRLAELQVARNKDKITEINFDLLPEEFQHLKNVK